MEENNNNLQSVDEYDNFLVSFKIVSGLVDFCFSEWHLC